MLASHLPAVLTSACRDLAHWLQQRSAARLPRLLLGMRFARGRRTVTSWLRAAGSAEDFRPADTTVNAVGRHTHDLAVSALHTVTPMLGSGRLRVAIDDTPSGRYGPCIEGAGIHHNPSPGPAGAQYLYGHIGVTLAALAQHPNWGTIAWPLQGQLYIHPANLDPWPPERSRPFRTKLERAGEPLVWLNTWAGHHCAERWVVVAGADAQRPFLRAAPAQGFTVVSRLRKDAAWWSLPERDPAARRGPGRPPTYGKQRIRLAQRAGQTRGWHQVECVPYGAPVVKTIKTFLATWRPAGGVIRLVLVQEENDWLPFFSSNPAATPPEILAAMADRGAEESAMPRKPKQEKQTITVVVNGTPITVMLHPPSGRRTSWFAYWNGLVASKSTGQNDLDDAIRVAENMVKNGGKQPVLADAVLSDEEFEAIQRAHFSKKTDPAAKARAEKTLEDCIDSIAAFRAITGLKPIAQATPDDCERFQQKALRLPKNWRQNGSIGDAPGDPAVETLSPNTVLKWCRQLQAAFERANRSATKRKCVRGGVEQSKLLTANPWSQFTWIEGRERPIRQFGSDDLLAFRDYLESLWAGVPVGAAAAKVFLWSSCRKLEVASLQWDSLRLVGDEHHFQIIGKRGVERWFRVPLAVYHELLSMKTSGPFVFAAYNQQLRRFHADDPNSLQLIRDKYNPRDFGRWFYQRVVDWSAEALDQPAFVHMFRKTTLQYARRGEDINRQVAQDARVSETVMLTNYVKESDEELRHRSNRTYQRIVASLAPEVAARYGYVEKVKSDMERRLEAAIASQNWDLAQARSAWLASKRAEAAD